MKLSSGFLFTIVILLVIVVITLWNSTVNFVPYSKNAGYAHQYSNEGFHGMKPYSYTTYPNNASIDSMNRFDIQKQNMACSKLKGDLFCNPEFKWPTMDIYSLAKGGCDGTNASGLSNSKGWLCLDKAMTSMLQTRGGNQTGADYQIGR
jgi:hypothetical protein